MSPFQIVPHLHFPDFQDFVKLVAVILVVGIVQERTRFKEIKKKGVKK